MVEKTNIYHHIKTGKELKVTLEEIKKFLGISMLMSTLGYPRIRQYWESTFKVPIIANAFPRDRYFNIRSAIHVVNDNDVTQAMKDEDRLWKVRPLVDKFRTAVLQIPRQEDASIDEQMIPFTGHVGFRQFVPRKPNPTGLKDYVLSSKDGLILDFEVYQGKNTTRLHPEVEGHLKLGTGGRAVLQLAETCPPGTNLYFDRYFTGLALLKALLALKEKGISGTGTTMKQRLPNIDFKGDAELNLEGRGAFDMKVNDDESVLALKWVDNKIITMASTRHGAEPFTMARRYSRATKQYIDVPMPNVVRQYNINMGGVDLHNRMLSHYRSYHRTNKWTVRFMEHFFDMACVNSWLKYKSDCFTQNVPKKDVMDLHSFKMRLAQLLIIGKKRLADSDTDSEEERPRKKSAGRPGKVPLPPHEARTKGALHIPIAMDLPFAQCCRNPNCSGKSRVKCTECDVYLCVLNHRNCFLNFHR
ncbi:piggyBac transposable element-derived protein 3-like [Nilaparvata lugens]|uniref:piggyBac transposable element-derived protein 3-like n=1 Tax=Nilaparvata lugens TaxID=108931 RepID=UPI000B98391A|nr:piggyBac transposable element-derived protein 3-like [Nilaparvata lugens]